MDVQEGYNHFNGKEALAFCRERHNLPDGDNQRGKNQQALLTGLIRSTMSPKILIHANGMINSVAGNADTNMSEKQMKVLIRMQLDTLAGWDIESVAAVGDSSGKKRCYSYNEETYELSGELSHKVYHLGQKVRVRVADADALKRTVDFTVVE